MMMLQNDALKAGVLLKVEFLLDGFLQVDGSLSLFTNQISDEITIAVN